MNTVFVAWVRFGVSGKTVSSSVSRNWSRWLCIKLTLKQESTGDNLFSTSAASIILSLNHSVSLRRIFFSFTVRMLLSVSNHFFGSSETSVVVWFFSNKYDQWWNKSIFPMIESAKPISTFSNMLIKLLNNTAWQAKCWSDF